MADEMMQRPAVVPYLTVRGASEAIAWYTRGLGAEVVVRMPVEGSDKLMHCELRINGGVVYMSDDFPEYGSSLGDGPRGVTVFLAVDDADRWYNRAIEAGATVRMEIADQFWGDRFGEVVDPFGHGWAFASPLPKNG
jgi:PhnB protein